MVRAHEALGRLQAFCARIPNPDLVTRTFDRREAVRSSQIEGTNSDVNDLFAYEATDSSEGLPADVRVTLNYVKALQCGLIEVRRDGINALTNGLIKKIHARLMDGVQMVKGLPGEFRTVQNWIGGTKIYHARFVPPPAAYVLDCMNDLGLLLRYAASEEDQFEVSIVIRMAIAHAQFETIHPFVDGNGRVGRILLPLMLAAEAYPPVYLAGFLKSNQQEYYDGLANVQLQENWVDWVKFFATGVAIAARESMRTAEELVAILGRWKERVSALGLRSDAAVYRLPEFIIGNPVLTAKQVKESLGISFPAASGALSLLEAQGILTQTVKQQRNRVFVAKEIIDLLDQPGGV